jgi:hypothetical protein
MFFFVKKYFVLLKKFFLFKNVFFVKKLFLLKNVFLLENVLLKNFFVKKCFPAIFSLTLQQATGQMIHTVVSPQIDPQSRMIINQNGQIINQHGQMVNQQVIQQSPQQHGQRQIIQNNMMGIPNGVNVQMANPNQQIINQESVHTMIRHNQPQMSPGVKLQPGQVIMNGGQFRPNLQMAPTHGPPARFAHGSPGPNMQNVPPRSPNINRSPMLPRLIPQKTMVVPVTCVEEQLHSGMKNKYIGHILGSHVTPDLCFLGCVFYFSENLSKSMAKESDYKSRSAKWRANIVIYGGLTEDTYNKVTCTHIVAGKNNIHESRCNLS